MGPESFIVWSSEATDPDRGHLKSAQKLVRAALSEGAALRIVDILGDARLPTAFLVEGSEDDLRRTLETLKTVIQINKNDTTTLL
jgi:hypothetical protein